MSADLTIARLLADKRMHVGSAIRKRVDEAYRNKRARVERWQLADSDEIRGFRPGQLVTVDDKDYRVVRVGLTWVEVKRCHG